MTHPCELFTADAIATLRDAQFEQTAENNTHLSPEVYLSWDEEGNTVELTTVSETNALLSLKASVTGTPKWFSLNIGLGRGSFAAGDVIGLVVETETQTPFEATPFVRTAVADSQHADTPALDTLAFEDGRQVITLLHTVGPDSALTTDAFHTLVIPLPGQDFQLDICDMRLFVIDADRALRTTPETLSSFG